MSAIENIELDLKSDLSRFAGLAGAFGSWDRWRSGAPAPRWQAVDMLELPSRMIPSTIVVDVVDGGEDLRFRFWGSAMVDFYESELTGQYFSHVSDRLFGRLPHAQYQKVINTAAPSLFSVTIRRPNDILAKRINLRLPIADGHGRVDKVMTVADIWKPDNRSIGEWISANKAEQD